MKRIVAAAFALSAMTLVACEEKKEARGETAQQATEGKSHVGARDKRESSRAMGGKNAKTTTRRSARRRTVRRVSR